MPQSKADLCHLLLLFFVDFLPIHLIGLHVVVKMSLDIRGGYSHWSVNEFEFTAQ